MYHEKNYPFVSILLPVRNEEKNIVRCLHSLSKISYPVEKLEILIGDDDSHDNTYSIIKNYISDKICFRLLHINSNIKGLKGKTNVLAYLAREAKGDYYFFTDADMYLPASWIKGMLNAFIYCDTGIVTGNSIVKRHSLLGRLQCIDWILLNGFLRMFYLLGLPVSGLGNNMAVKKEAYWDTGGYENIPFSVVEDYRLFYEIVKKGWGFENLLNPDVLAVTLPLNSFGDLLVQRKRWLRGAFQTPVYFKLLLLALGLYYPLIIILMFYNWMIGIIFLIIKSILQFIFIHIIDRKLKIRQNSVDWALFEIYAMILTFSSLIYYLLPVKIKWKGRIYS